MKSSLSAILGGLLLAGCQDKVERVEWPVMGTVASLQTRGSNVEVIQSGARDAAQKSIREVTGFLNAHDPASELNRLAASDDAEVLRHCDAVVRPCYVAAFRLSKATGGAFNPRWRGTNTLDLGAIAKGFAIDRAVDATYVGDNGSNSGLLDLGGNVKSIRGNWRTGVKDPFGEGIAAVVDLKMGESLATSATYYRGQHIVDGRTGQPVSNEVASVTVLAKSAMWADGLSTTLFILGPDEGRTFLNNKLSELCGDQKVSVLWILKDGTQLTYGDARFSRD